jgi:hypothetical protein
MASSESCAEDDNVALNDFVCDTPIIAPMSKPILRKGLIA